MKQNDIHKNNSTRNMNHDGILFAVVTVSIMLTSIIFLYMVAHGMNNAIMLGIIIIAFIIEIILLVLSVRHEVNKHIKEQTDAIINDSMKNK